MSKTIKFRATDEDQKLINQLRKKLRNIPVSDVIRRALEALAVSLGLLLIGCGGSPKPAATAGTQTVVFVGDSISFFWAIQGADFPSRGWVDHAVSGVNSLTTRRNFVSDVINMTPKPCAVHILTGTNDVYPGWVLHVDGVEPDTAKNITEMVQIARDNDIVPIIGTIPPWGIGPTAATADSSPERFDRINQLNDWIRQFGVDNHVKVIEYHDALMNPFNAENYQSGLTIDGVHPAPAGYSVMTQLADERMTTPCSQSL